MSYHRNSVCRDIQLNGRRRRHSPKYRRGLYYALHLRGGIGEDELFKRILLLAFSYG